jgi:hypothetical protein
MLEQYCANPPTNPATTVSGKQQGTMKYASTRTYVLLEG